MASQPKHSDLETPASSLLPPAPIPGGPPVSVPIALIPEWMDAHGLVMLDSGHRLNVFPPIMAVAPKTSVTEDG